LNILVTGGAGFIGRWVVKRLLEDGHKVWVLDDLSNGQRKNIEEFLSNPNFAGFVEVTLKTFLFLKPFLKTSLTYAITWRRVLTCRTALTTRVQHFKMMWWVLSMCWNNAESTTLNCFHEHLHGV